MSRQHGLEKRRRADAKEPARSKAINRILRTLSTEPGDNPRDEQEEYQWHKSIGNLAFRSTELAAERTSQSPANTNWHVDHRTTVDTRGHDLKFRVVPNARGFRGVKLQAALGKNVGDVAHLGIMSGIVRAGAHETYDPSHRLPSTSEFFDFVQEAVELVFKEEFLLKQDKLRATAPEV